MLSKLTGHRNSCDLCKPTVRGSGSGGPTLPHYAGRRDRPGYIDGMRQAGVALVPAQRWTIRRYEEGR